MKLPLPSLHKKKTQDYYLALLLRDEKVVAVILHESEGALQVVGRDEAFLQTSIDTIEHEALLEVLDKVISKAEEALPPDMETEKTVFGVKDSWVEGKKIKKEYLSKLKKVCETLTLTPIGFMVISEAIAHLLQKEEGAPLSGVVAEIGKTKVTLSLFRAGRVIETYTDHITDSIPKTVDRLLHHFTADVLPSRIIIFNGGNDEGLAQEFLAHHWSKSLPFLHMPQVSVLPSGFDGKAMVYGAAEQMGFGVSGIDLAAEDKEEPAEASHHKNKEEETDEVTPPESEKETPNFGFVTDKDITQVSPHKSETHPRKDMVESEHELPAHPAFEQTEKTDKADEEPQERTGIFAALPLQKVSDAIGSLVGKLPLKSVPFGRFRENKLFLIIPLIVVLLLGLVLLYVFTVKATVTLSMESKHIAEGEQITFSPDSSLDFAQKIIPAKEVEVSLPGTKTTDATGKKEVGDKAEGTVTLYNNTSSPKSLPAGSVITSSNDLDFVTDKDVTIASASGDIFSGTKPGTTKVDVTAKDIGSEYNLPSNTKFTVSSSSSLAAKNDSAFSGGTKKNITVVSKNDQSKLVEDLPKSLEDKAKDELAKKLGEGEIALPGFIDEQVGQKKYSKDLNDEADNVTLQATVTFTALTYKKADMKELAQSLLKDTHSQELAISAKGVQTTVKDIKPDKNDDDVSATLAMEANLLPKINTDSLLQQLPGKSFAGASNLIRQKDPQVKNIDITLSPNIPFLPKLLPLVKDHIKITISANE